MQITIIGLGLMGGSLALALIGFHGCEITGYDIDGAVMQKALAAHAIDRAAGSVSEAVKSADLSIFCTYPGAIISDIQRNIDRFKKGSIISEICGVKSEMMTVIPPLLPQGIDYVGLHPMAGKEVDGFDNADASLFRGAGFIIVAPYSCQKSSVDLLTALSRYVGAGRICVNNAEDHDRIIAYTSDLMHISATALCAVPPGDMTMAHTAGAFRDCTRIANINPALWTELFLQNRRHIIPVLEEYIRHLTAFQTALEHKDKAFIYDFLDHSTKNKKEMQTK